MMCRIELQYACEYGEVQAKGFLVSAVHAQHLNLIKFPSCYCLVLVNACTDSCNLFAHC